MEIRSRFNSLDSGLLLNSPIDMFDSPLISDLPAELEEITLRAANNASKLTFAPSVTPAPVASATTIGRSVSFNPAASMRSAQAPVMNRANSLTPAPVSAPVHPVAPSQSHQQDKENAANSGSIAVRAMRSMKSLAHIGSWAQLNREGSDSMRGMKEAKKDKEQKVEKKDSSIGLKKKKSKKEKDFKPTLASVFAGPDGSSKAGASTPSPTEPAKSERTSLGDRKRSVLGLGVGWPATLRSAISPILPSEASQTPAPSPVVTVTPAPLPQPTSRRAPPSAFASHRLSAEVRSMSIDSQRSVSSADGIPTTTVGRARAGSRGTTSSTNSSVRPLSSSSGGSCGSSAISVRWDEEGLATVKEARARERASSGRRKGGESRSSNEEKKRTSLASVFPETSDKIKSGSKTRNEKPNKKGEEASANEVTSPAACSESTTIGVMKTEDDKMSIASVTPVKIARRRPMSEQLMGKSRPRGIKDDSEGIAFTAPEETFT